MLTLAVGGDDPDHLGGNVHDVESGEVIVVDAPVGEYPLAQPVQQPVPLVLAHRITGSG